MGSRPTAIPASALLAGAGELARALGSRTGLASGDLAVQQLSRGCATRSRARSRALICAHDSYSPPRLNAPVRAQPRLVGDRVRISTAAGVTHLRPRAARHT